MDYMVAQDVESILEILDYTTDKFAEEIGMSRITISNWINYKTTVSEKHVDDVYCYAYRCGIKLNKIKEQFYREDVVGNNQILLFHGAKNKIVGNLSNKHNKKINDFGNGFYCGESFEQSAMFVATYPQSCVYMLSFNPEGLRYKEFVVNREWMLTIAYYRGRLDEYRETKVVKEIAQALDGLDYVIAPIADNRMFEIIDSFIDEEITDVQCQHCLSATNLGRQYVFISDEAINRVELLERCYLTSEEKNDYLNSRQDSYGINMDKVKLARKQYRNQGEYIEEILK